MSLGNSKGLWLNILTLILTAPVIYLSADNKQKAVVNIMQVNSPQPVPATEQIRMEDVNALVALASTIPKRQNPSLL